MIRELKSSHSYLKVMFILSVATLLFGFGYCMLGELLLPFAISSLAALFVLEKPNKRFLSYLIPPIPVIVAIVTYGAFAVITAQYVVYALILALIYRFSKTKATAAFYLTLFIALFFAISLYISGAINAGSFAFEAVVDYYSDIYTALKGKLVESLSSYTVTANDGSVQKPISAEVAASYIEMLSKLAVSFIGILAFLIAGISIKLFKAFILNFSKHGILKTFSHFLPSNTAAYIYIVVSILTIFTGTSDIIDLTILNISQILMLVFAYMGFQYVSMIGNMSGKKTTVIFGLLAAILLLNTLAIQILSYLGAWITIGTNRSLRPIDKD